ncbi:MAG TPA: amidohydrolase family protein [Actinomycetota bacterium]|nr:amidohydrolase family protein [Actinomycetota bacterium]
MTSRVLLAGGCVLTLGARTPNHRQADVLIDDGVIAEVGPSIRVRDAEQVDATDTIVMPGFVDTHRHAWTSLFRNAGEREANADPAEGVHNGYTADDVFAATLIGLLGAAEAGITTVVDWSHAGDDLALAEAALRAHEDARLRTVFVHTGGGRGLGEHVARLTGSAGPTTSIAFGTVSPGAAELDAAARDWTAARELGLRIHVHVGSNGLSAAAGSGMLGDDVTVVHGSPLEPPDVDAVASSGAAISIAPVSEMAGGHGAPPIQRLVDADVRPGLAVDDERVAPGDLFAQMRAAISMQHATVFDLKLAGKGGVPKLMTTRNVIRFATSDGARAAGLRGVSGSLEAGMRADVLVLRADRPNIFPVNDPIGAVVWGMDTSNVDWVFVGGRALMRGGVLDADVQRARSLATEARRRVAEVPGSIVGAAPGGTG